MRKNVQLFLFLIISGAPLFFSCAGSPVIAPSDMPDEPTSASSPAPVYPENPLLQGNIPPTERRAPKRAAEGTPEWSELPSWAEQQERPERSQQPERTAAVNPKRSGWSWWLEQPERSVLPEQTNRPERLEQPAPERDPVINRPLLGRGQTDAEKLAAFLLAANSKADPEFVRQLSRFYVEEAALEGIDHDVAFAQMCLETGFLRYGGLVTPDMNNFCGLGALGPGTPGERFLTPQIGVRAQIQHLKGYATEEPPTQELVDPRYKYVRYGSAPTIEGLAGTWAVDRAYAYKIAAILKRLYTINSITADSDTVDSDTVDSVAKGTDA